MIREMEIRHFETDDGLITKQYIDGAWRPVPVEPIADPIPPDPEPIPPDPVDDDPMGQWSEGNRDSNDGATRDYYNRAASLKWKHQIGDWLDAEGTPQGNVPFASAAITTVPAVMSFDVTEIVNKWLDGTWINKGFMVRAPSTSISWRSKEYDDKSKWPALVFIDENDQKTVIRAAADSRLDRGTYTDQGASTALIAHHSVNTIIRFVLPDIPSTHKAQLTLYAYNKISGAAQADVYRLSQTHYEPNETVRYGIANEVEKDSDLEGRDDVYMVTSFDEVDETGSENWQAKWSSHYAYSLPTVVDETNAYPGLNFQKWEDKALQIHYTPGINQALNSLYAFEDKGFEKPVECYMRYMLRLSDPKNPDGGYAPAYAGKVPGWGATTPKCGNGGAPADGECWSARGHYNTYPPDHNELAGYFPIGNYVYHMDQSGNYGSNFMWSKGYNGLLLPDRWYCIDQYIRVNTPAIGTEPEMSDGILRGWVDGKLAHEKTDIRFRRDPEANLKYVWFNFYHGGKPKPERDMYLWIANVVIAKNYIGPRD